jgi:CelD/BcsL family acetyltransferase involved in cellulose biosynthesis
MVRCGVVSVCVSEVTDFITLGERWRDLEQRSECSFFQSWTWVGCLAAERFPDAVLVEAIEAGRTVALGLFNRVRHRVGPPTLFLGENGTAELDCPYVEQNGILTEAGCDADLTALCLRSLAAAHDVVLSGVGAPVLAAAQHAACLVAAERGQESPFIDLAAVRRAGGNYLAGRSANTRHQVRRSDRFYQRGGPIRLERAGSVQLAHVMLDRMAELHQAVWEGRGKPGSFSAPFFRRFHYALIEVGLPRGEIALLKVLSGDTTIGFLYNFVWRGRMSAYQSGFAYRGGEGQAKPGVTCHHAGILAALDLGLDVYDFLAGNDRYKRSLANQSQPQYWLELGPFWSPRLLRRAVMQRFRSSRLVPGSSTPLTAEEPAFALHSFLY